MFCAEDDDLFYYDIYQVATSSILNGTKRRKGALDAWWLPRSALQLLLMCSNSIYTSTEHNHSGCNGAIVTVPWPTTCRSVLLSTVDGRTIKQMTLFKQHLRLLFGDIVPFFRISLLIRKGPPLTQCLHTSNEHCGMLFKRSWSHKVPEDGRPINLLKIIASSALASSNSPPLPFPFSFSFRHLCSWSDSYGDSALDHRLTTGLAIASKYKYAGCCCTFHTLRTTTELDPILLIMERSLDDIFHVPRCRFSARNIQGAVASSSLAKCIQYDKS